MIFGIEIIYSAIMLKILLICLIPVQTLEAVSKVRRLFHFRGKMINLKTCEEK